MSAAGATTAPLRRASAAASPLSTPRQPRPSAPVRSRAQLSIVAPRATVAGRTLFAVLVAAILLSGLMGLLLVHTLAAQDAFRVHDLNQRLATLQDTEQQLAISSQQAASPTELRARAEALGMRPSQIDGYRHTKDGRVVGTLTAIPLQVTAPVPAPTSTTTAAHKPAAKKPRSKASKSAGTKATAGHAGHHAKGHTGASHN
jgi:outer membrane murein-binding lipoprotein Lpp